MRGLLIGLPAGLLSGALFLLALPPADWSLLGWVCFAPLFWGVRGRGLATGVISALAAALFAGYLSTTGLTYSWAAGEGEAGWHYVGFFLFSFPLIVLCGLVGEKREFSPRGVLLLAASAVLLEACLLAYLPAHLALTQYRSVPMLYMASVTGVWGPSFLLWLFNLGSVLLPVPARRRWPALVSVTILAVLLSLGHPRPLGPGELVRARPGESTIAVLQTVSGDKEDLSRWNREATAAGAQIVVWPELSAVAIASGGRTDELKELSGQEGHAPFVTTFPDDAEPMPFNVAALFSSSSESDRYRKRKPFGGESKMHQAGKVPVAVPLPGRDGRLGLNVCFDSCFPAVMRDTAKTADVRLIALPCMGPETPYGFAQAVHGAFTPFRSAELGVPIARGESSAFAMITDSRGRIVTEAPSGYQGVLLGNVRLERRFTVYKMLGDWVLWACGGLLFVSFVAEVKRRREARKEDDGASKA